MAKKRWFAYMTPRRRKRRKGRKKKGTACRRVRVCGKLRMICRDRKGRIKSNSPAKRRRRRR